MPIIIDLSIFINLKQIIHFQFTLFLTKHNILSPFQSGFRPGHSTVKTLAKVNDDIWFGIVIVRM